MTSLRPATLAMLTEAVHHESSVVSHVLSQPDKLREEQTIMTIIIRIGQLMQEILAQEDPGVTSEISERLQSVAGTGISGSEAVLHVRDIVLEFYERYVIPTTLTEHGSRAIAQLEKQIVELQTYYDDILIMPCRNKGECVNIINHDQRLFLQIGLPESAYPASFDSRSNRIELEEEYDRWHTVFLEHISALIGQKRGYIAAIEAHRRK